MTTFRRISFELTLAVAATALILVVTWLPGRLWSGLVPRPEPYTPLKLEVRQARVERLTWPARAGLQDVGQINIWTGAAIEPPEDRHVIEDRPGVTVFVSGDTIIEQSWLHQTRDGRWHPPMQIRQAPGGGFEMNIGADSAPRWVWWAIEKLNREEGTSRQSDKSE